MQHKKILKLTAKKFLFSGKKIATNKNISPKSVSIGLILVGESQG